MPNKLNSGDICMGKIHVQKTKIFNFLRELACAARKRKGMYGRNCSSKSSWEIYWIYKGIPMGLIFLEASFKQAAGDKKDFKSIKGLNSWASEWLRAFRYSDHFCDEFGCSMGKLISLKSSIADVIEKKGTEGLEEKEVSEWL